MFFTPGDEIYGITKCHKKYDSEVCSKSVQEKVVLTTNLATTEEG